MDGNHVEEDSIGRVRLVLASASPRRADLLRAAGIEFDVLTGTIDESRHPGEGAEAYVTRLAEAKARAVVARAGGRPVLGADTVVVCGEEILGKPVDAKDAKRMLRDLSGRTHLVMTGVCLIHEPAEAGPHASGVGAASGVGSASGVGAGFSRLVVTTAVQFAPLTEAEIDWYVASGEPEGKAGAYAIQGLASRFVTAISGSYTNVVGLPVALVHNLCKNAGILVS